MRVYVEFIKNAFKENLAYRTNYFTGFVGIPIMILVQVYLWRTLLGYSGQASTNMGVVTIGDMTTYILISTMITILTGFDYLYFYIDERIKTGLISMDLIKPLNFQAYMFSRMIGTNLFSFLFRLLPVLVLGIVFFGMKYPSVENLPLFFCHHTEWHSNKFPNELHCGINRVLVPTYMATRISIGEFNPAILRNVDTPMVLPANSC